MGVSLQMFIETTKNTYGSASSRISLKTYWQSLFCVFSTKNKSNSWFQSGSLPMFFSQLGMMALFEGHANFGEVLNLLFFFRCKLADLLFFGWKNVGKR